MHLDFYGAPVLICGSVLAAGRAGSWAAGGRWPFQLALGVAPALFVVITGLAPRSFSTKLSAAMHQLKGTHTQNASKRQFNFHEVRPGLLLGRQFTKEEDLRNVRENKGVTDIVTINEEWELFVPSTVVVQQLGGDEHRLRFTTPDFQAPTQSELDVAVEFIRTKIAAGGVVYVHCNAGKGRSSVVVAAYLLATEPHWESASAVVKDLRRLRPCVSFGLLDWPFRGQARAVAQYHDQCQRIS